jgi:pilus assembly protein CpaB
VNSRPRRRRGLLLLSLALASGGLAASEVSRKVAEVDARVGRPVPVVIAREALPPGEEIPPGAVGRLLRITDVPEKFAPPDGLSDPAEAAGLAPAVPVAAGSVLTVGHFAGSADDAQAGRGLLRPGERAVEVAVAGGEALASAAPGTRVDVLVSTEPRSGGGSTFVALEGVELLALGGAPGGGGFDPAASGEGASAAATALATLRVTLRQAVYLTAAQNFAREVRLLPRPPGDRDRLGRFGVSAAGL